MTKNKSATFVTPDWGFTFAKFTPDMNIVERLEAVRLANPGRRMTNRDIERCLAFGTHSRPYNSLYISIALNKTHCTASGTHNWKKIGWGYWGS